MKREDLLRSKQYGISKMKYTLLNLIGRFKNENNLKDKDIADKLGVSKSYISQILNGTFDHKMSKVGDIANACNAIPILSFVDIDEYIRNDKNGCNYVLVPSPKYSNITFQTLPYSLPISKTRSNTKKRKVIDPYFSETRINTSPFTVQ
jgi:transcriptional regulator with XRE-family HTH domain